MSGQESVWPTDEDTCGHTDHGERIDDDHPGGDVGCARKRLVGEAHPARSQDERSNSREQARDNDLQVRIASDQVGVGDRCQRVIRMQDGAVISDVRK